MVVPAQIAKGRKPIPMHGVRVKRRAEKGKSVKAKGNPDSGARADSPYSAFALLVLGQTEAESAAAVRAGGPVANGGTQVPRKVVPGAATNYA